MKESTDKDICNEGLFASFFNKHSKALFNFLYYKFGEKLNPEDKVQEAFLKVWQNCHKITPDKAKSFLYTTANNLMLNQANHEKVKLKYAEIPQKSHTNESPEYVMEENQYMEKIQNALSKLTEAQRVAFLLNRVEGKRFKEIAEILNISTKAVEKRIYGALKKLREDIEGL
ncbi:MAG: sigma-70 family RNA polymerase sigma factor [Tenacibaculum sp.]|nr:sigma-70 family RNA polymerase sigma factor [Tenacibaculum sp.]